MLRIKRNLIFMPAFLKTLLYPTISLTIIFLVGCSRDNPLSVPDDGVDIEISCAPILPDLALLADIEITNTSLSYPSTILIDEEEVPTVAFGFAPGILNYNAEVDHLINSVVITPSPMNIDAINQELKTDSEKTVGIKEFSSIEIKLNNVQVNAGSPDSTFALSEELIKVNILVRAKFNVYVNTANELGICEQVFTADNAGELTDDQETVQRNQVSTYTIKITRNQFNALTTLPVELTSAISAANDEFGRAISIGNTLESNSGQPAIIGTAIGVPHARVENQADDENNKVDAGGVSIYEQVDKNDWIQTVLINAAKPDIGDLFGYSVSLSNGFLAVSAPGEDSFNSGIFPWVDNTGNFDADNNPIGDGINDNLNVEISNVANSSGAVYIFKKEISEPNGWRQIAFIKQPTIQPGLANYDIGFGKKVLLVDNLLLIAAPQQQVTTEIDEASTIVNSGIVYAYRYDTVTETWSLSTRLLSENPNANDNFGSALATHNDFILIGASGENNGRGSAHLFAPSGNSWNLSATLTASNSDPGDAFGTSLAISPTKIFIGASKEDSFGKSLNRNKGDNSLNDSGAVYGYSKNEPEDPWVEFVYIKADTSMENAQFGYAINFESGNLIIGEPFRSNGSSSGQIYLYELYEKALQASNIIAYNSVESSLSSNNTQMNDRFGSSIALFERIFAVGANGFTNRESGINKTNSGKAYIFQ
ncbi:MAG: hypothetical protein ACI84K_000337 [Pseudohongiellaceae bacterium]|jgi:hypothetical protein